MQSYKNTTTNNSDIYKTGSQQARHRLL